MKNNIIKGISMLLVFIGVGCTGDFDEINKKPDQFSKEELSARFFLTSPQANLYSAGRFYYWRANLIHGDRFAGHVCFGHDKSWWSDETGYKYHGGYTDATWKWLAEYLGGLNNYLDLVKKGGDFENDKMYAVGLIMKGLYYQKFTDIFGMLPYTEAGVEGINQPKFDEQKTIYKGIIADLDKAMGIIGDSQRTGVGVEDLSENDIMYGGDLQKWKKLANTLKLRMAMRALGASGDDFCSKAISEAVTAPLLDSEKDNCLIQKDKIIDQYQSAGYGDIWQSFGDPAGWSVSKELIGILKKNNDPRLKLYAKPAKGGKKEFKKPEGDLASKHTKRLNFIKQILTDEGVPFVEKVVGDDTTIEVPKDKYYIGQPTRVNGDTKAYMFFDFFSTPADDIINSRALGTRPEIIMTSAEAYFLRAEAALRGFSTDDAQVMFSRGIEEAMKVWGVKSEDYSKYLSSPFAQLTGTQEDKIEKIALQRWISSYTDGFEGWSIVRDYGYPKSLAEGVFDFDIFGVGDTNGKYPQRMRYGTSVYNTNGNSLKKALEIQGSDEMTVKMWWAK